jgi:hypothetical protein
VDVLRDDRLGLLGLMVPIIYRSTDASAPTLSGTVGSLVALLDACLVNGYGAKAAAGWSKPFTGTNRACFRPGAGPRHYLDVYDNAATTGGAKEAECRGFETMTAAGVGTHEFPSVGTAAVMRKSASADGTARTWILIADDRTMYLWVDTTDIGSLSRFGYTFGEFFSMKASGDVARSVIAVNGTENSGNVSAGHMHACVQSLQNGQQLYAPRAYHGMGPPIAHAKIHQTGFTSLGTGLTIGIGLLPFPNPEDNGLYVSPIQMVEVIGGIPLGVRGRLRGYYSQMHPVASFNAGEEFAGCGDYVDKTFIILCRNAAGGWVTFETSEWEVSE